MNNQTQTPEQLSQWRVKFEALYANVPSCLIRKDNGEYRDDSVEDELSGYLRAKSEQAAEIATLKAQLAEIKKQANRLLHQIDIGDFVDSHGHSAKMLKPVHDLMKFLKD